MIRMTHVGALFFSLAVVACSSNSNNPAETNRPTAPGSSAAAPSSPQAGGGSDCAGLASAAEISAIVGETVTGPKTARGQFGPGVQATACQYTAPDGVVGFSFGKGPDEATVRTVFDQSKQSQNGQDVAGLGDAAYFSADEDNLLVIQGTTFLSVGLVLASIGGGTQEQAADVAIAQKVLPKL